MPPMQWVTGSWHSLFASPWDWVMLALAAVLSGSVVGLERERKGKPVGLRTLSLVSLGAAVFTMVSTGFGANGGEALRIAPQVVSGIGFLGAGVILRGRFGVAGLTSAATIWAVAAAGMVVGTGYGGAGIALSLFILLLLFLLSAVEHRYAGPCRFVRTTVTYRLEGGKTYVRIIELLDEYRVPPDAREPLPDTGDPAQGQIRIRHCGAHQHHREFLSRLAEFTEVTGISSVQDLKSVTSGSP